MEQKINIAELLKYCPKGMELDCMMYDNCTFDGIGEYLYPIKVQTPDGQISLNKYGCYSSNKHAKCVIFPKGKTTWEGFVPPCEFKDGDIVADVFGGICIYKNGAEIKGTVNYYCGILPSGDFKIKDEKHPERHFGCIGYYHLATEEEKTKLFDAIKDNGYRWNPETKTLERLTPNKFDTTTLKPFDKVLVRHNKDNKWCCSFFSHIDKDLHSHCYKFVTTAGKSYPHCIPYEGNKKLRGTTNDCDEYFKNW